MIDGQPYYHSTIRKTVIAFGQLFNNIRIQRKDADSALIQTLKIPLSYGPKQKFLVRIRQNPTPDTNSNVEITVPRLGFEITSLTYDASRKVQQLSRQVAQSSDETLTTAYNPVPYNINFALYVMVRNQDDGLQILEQILPFFRPEYTLAVNFIPELKKSQDLSFVLKNVSVEDDYEGDFNTRNAIIWTLDFSANIQFYGPIVQQGPIKKVIATIFPNMPGYAVPIVDRYTAEVDPLTANPEDDYTILETWELIDNE